VECLAAACSSKTREIKKGVIVPQLNLQSNNCEESKISREHYEERNALESVQRLLLRTVLDTFNHAPRTSPPALQEIPDQNQSQFEPPFWSCFTAAALRPEQSSPPQTLELLKHDNY
jgi:hypothetical protein